MKTLGLIFFAVLLSTGCIAQSGNIDILFYNTENLFDTLDNPKTKDEDFTPHGRLNFDSKRFETKTQHIADVINASLEENTPEIIGLCEVENMSAVRSVVNKMNDSEAYTIHLAKSSDIRGITNALIVHDRFKVLKQKDHHIALDDSRPTRPILAAYLEDKKSNERFWILINHWPSRYGGTAESNWKRMEASAVLTKTISHYRSKYPDAHLIAMGDFNDYPTDESVLEQEKCEGENDPCLVNMHRHIQGSGAGTYCYYGKWDVLDQIMVSQSLIDPQSSINVQANSGKIVKHDWMLYKSKKYDDMLPNRTYNRETYYGGYSDHLPVTLTLLAN